MYHRCTATPRMIRICAGRKISELSLQFGSVRVLRIAHVLEEVPVPGVAAEAGDEFELRAAIAAILSLADVQCQPHFRDVIQTKLLGAMGDSHIGDSDSRGDLRRASP